MTSQPKLDTYPLARGVIDSVRLNLCHFIWKKSFPWVVHPSVSIEGRADLRIADVGCGTGIWLLEAAELHPNAAALEGLDIALHQTPPEHLLPNNVRFKHLDLQEELPAEFIGRYDLVHARFLLGLVKNNDPVPLLKNLLKLLKPGGYLQWNEVDWASDVYIGLSETNTPLSSSGLHAMRAAGLAFLGPITWPQNLSSLLTSQGLKDVVLEKKTVDDYPKMYARFWTDALVAAGIDSVSKMPEGSEIRAKMARLVDDAGEDARKGVGWCGDHFCVVGRKEG